MNGKADWTVFVNPVVVIALGILLGTFALIGSAIFGWDHGVLIGMAKYEFARGVITYLFAVVTIGVAVVMVVFSLTTSVSEDSEKRFQRAKEVLSLLLGIFGTVIGFYFASDVRGTAGAPSGPRLASLLIMPQSVPPGGRFGVTTTVQGGTPPFTYGIAMSPTGPASFDAPVTAPPWIYGEQVVPDGAAPGKLEVSVGVVDAAGRTDLASGSVTVAAKQGR